MELPHISENKNPGLETKLTIFFEIEGIIIIEWVSEGQDVNQKYSYYRENLIKLR